MTPGSSQARHRAGPDIPTDSVGLAGTGFIATVATILVAALAQAVGFDFEIPDGGETIPLSGFAVVTGFFSVVGIVIAPLFFVGALAPPSDSCRRQEATMNERGGRRAR